MRLIAALLLALMTFCAAAQPAPAQKPIADAPTTNEEVRALRAQIEVMQEYKDDLLTTVYWSLGGVFAIVVLLAGWSWFGAFRIQQAEVKRIHSELSNDLQGWKNEANKSVAQTAELQNEAASKQINDLFNGKTKEINRKIADNKQDIEEIKNQLLLQSATAEVRYWEHEDVPANVFTSCMSLLEAAKRNGASWEINHALEKMTTIAREHRRNVDADDISALLPQLESLPSEHAISVEHLRDALRRAP